MDEFDDWPISDEEIIRLGIHVNDHPAEGCDVCQANAKAREKKAWKALQNLNDQRYSRIQDELQGVEGALKESLLRELGEVQRQRYARVPWAEYLENEDCIIGGTYAIWSRNLQFGVFRDYESGGFVGIREKFSDLFIFCEYHYDVGMAVGTVEPWVHLEQCPIADLRENLDSKCALHDRPCAYDKTKPKVSSYDPKITNSGTWCHSDDGSVMPKGDYSTRARNEELFEYLESVEQRYNWKELMVSVGRISADW